MDRHIKRVFGRKILYHHSAPIMFYLLFSLIAIAPIVLSWFFKFFSFGVEGTTFTLTAMDLVKGGFFNQPSDAWTNFMTIVREKITIEGQLKDIFNQAFPIIFQYVLPSLFGVVSIFTLILAIMSLKILFLGKLTFWKGPRKMAFWIFFFSIFTYGPIIGLRYGVPGLNDTYPIDTLFPIIYISCIFGAYLILCIIYWWGLRKRVYCQNKKHLDEYILKETYGVYDSKTYNIEQRTDFYKIMREAILRDPIKVEGVDEDALKKWINELVEKRVTEEVAKIKIPEPQIIEKQIVNGVPTPVVVSAPIKEEKPVVQEAPKKPIKITFRTQGKVKITKKGGAKNVKITKKSNNNK